ncbi:MAG: YlxR family protein, partial [Bacilli bacterium]|nr:YlxR family protein [Bacilli bacterium]
MKVKKIPMRTCVVTKESLPKSELLRIVRSPYGEVLVDLTGKQNGRGAYIKKDIAVLE